MYANDQQNSVAEYEKFELNANNLNNPDVILVINKSNRLHNDVVDKFMKLAQELKLNPVVVDDIDIQTGSYSVQLTGEFSILLFIFFTFSF